MSQKLLMRCKAKKNILTPKKNKPIAPPPFKLNGCSLICSMTNLKTFQKN